MTDFPMDIVIFNKISEVFNQTRGYVLLLFPLAFFIRIAFGFILLKGSDFTDILKDSLFLFLGLFFFMDILRLTLQIPYFLASDLSFREWRHINLGEGFFTKALQRIVEWIGILSYWISFGLYAVIISILGFLAGYILFLGTMFRAYGMLKVFFILLFTASLWPLLWHSINFAVWTIAVSDNALANNVIVGGASLAKVMLPLWIMSKSSKIPIAQGLKKVSFTSGGLTGAGAISAYSLLKGKKETSYQEETESEATTAYISQTDEVQSPAQLDFPHSMTEDLGEGGYEGDYGEPEDFAFREEGAENGGFQTASLSLKENEAQNKEKETAIDGHTALKSQTVRESHIQTETKHQKAESLPDNPQTVYEAKDSVSKTNQNLNQNPSQNQSMTLNEEESKDLSQNESILSSERSAVSSQSADQRKSLFNEAVREMDFAEEGEGSFSRPLENAEKESNL